MRYCSLWVCEGVRLPRQLKETGDRKESSQTPADRTAYFRRQGTVSAEQELGYLEFVQGV